MLVLRVMEKGGAAAAAHGGSSGPTANMTVQDM